MKDDISYNLTPEQNALSARILNLVLGRVLKRVYSNLDSERRKEMKKVFESGNDAEKVKFAKKHMSNFKLLFEEEGKSVEKELKDEIMNQI